MEKLLSQRFCEQDRAVLSAAVHNAYAAVNELFNTNDVLGRFLVGLDQRPRLISVYVEYALTNIALPGYRYEIALNAAKNCSHTILYKNNSIITAHFLGSTRPRKMARKAIHRICLHAQNEDLFYDEKLSFIKNQIGDSLYCHLYHHGLKQPDFVALAIPTSDQKGIIGEPLLLPYAEPNKAKVEEIKENITLRLINPADKEKQDPKKVDIIDGTFEPPQTSMDKASVEEIEDKVLEQLKIRGLYEPYKPDSEEKNS